MNKVILISLIMLLLTVACKKKHTVHIIAKNAVTGEPYAGLSWAIKGTRTGTNGEKLAFSQSGTLNQNGEAVANIKVNENLTFHVGCNKPPNSCYVKDINFYWDAKVNPSPTFQFEYAECANFKLEIHNINCLGSADEIKFKRTWLNGDTPDFFQTQLGCLNFVGEYFTLPIGNYKYEWEVTRSGNTTYHDSLFTLVENQNYTFVLNY